ncbi:phasin family protein [Bifidobacterium simiarum]|uniref:phasin family protein n=1 Tax=Bifidobacterium simiarum TaxID=2045441 RepID=UPI001BDD64F8|nr:phasin family protein [Bifidobacterium simiarum]MBT1165610.1 phasin family protein [Bifidobacterium simiarum]
MAEFNFNNLGDGLRTIFLAGVGAVATGAEKGQQIVDELVKKGEISVEQGKVLNSELSRKAQGAAKDAFSTASGVASDAADKAREAFTGVQDAALKARLAGMSSEERAAYAAKVQEFVNEANAGADAANSDKETVDAEVAEDAPAAGAADAPTGAESAETKDAE